MRIQDFQEEGTPIAKVGRQHNILANFLQKLHENETNWTQRGELTSLVWRPLSLNLRSAAVHCSTFFV